MALDDVIQEIKEEAEEEAATIREDAEERAEDILEEAREKKQALLEEARDEAEQEADALRQRKLSAARMEARKQRQQARQEVMEEAFDAFRERVHDLDEDDAADLLQEALDRLDGRIDIGTVQARDAFADLADEYGDHEAADIDGMIVESADGSRRFDLRFDTVAERTIDAHKQDVSRVLFD